MVKHVIVWKFKQEIENKEEKAAEIKNALEGLLGKIDGLEEMRILTDKLPSSSGDVMMDSTFQNNTALQNYQKHPLHVKIADELVRPVMETRMSFDFEA